MAKVEPFRNCLKRGASDSLSVCSTRVLEPERADRCLLEATFWASGAFSDSFSALDFSHLLARRVGYVPRPSSRRGLPCTYPSERSSKLTALRKGLRKGLLRRFTVGPTQREPHAPSGWRRLRFVRTQQPLPGGGGRFFMGWLRAPSRKKSKEYHGTLDLCRLPGGQMAKVELRALRCIWVRRSVPGRFAPTLTQRYALRAYWPAATYQRGRSAIPTRHAEVLTRRNALSQPGGQERSQGQHHHSRAALHPQPRGRREPLL